MTTTATLHKAHLETTVRIVKETPKAIQVEGNCSKAWFPKSALDIGTDNMTGETVMVVKDWFTNRTGIEHSFLFFAPAG